MIDGQSAFDAAQMVRPLLARLIGHNPGAMVRQPYGHANVVYRLPDHGLVAKTSTQLGAFDHTAANLRILRALDIPVPHAVASGDDGVHAALVLRWILGHALARMTTREKRRLATQVVEIQSRVCALPFGKGFGWTPIGVPGPFPSWLAVVERDHGRLPEALGGRIDLRPWRRELRPLPPVPFLDDLTVKNVIVEGGRLRGIVDLEHVCYGDPLYALALAETTAVLDCDDADYGRLLREAWGLDPNASRRADLYAALFAASFLERGAGERMAIFLERRLARIAG